MERRRQRRKAAERSQRDREAEMMATSPANTQDHQQETFDGVVPPRQHGTAGADAEQGRRRRPRRRRPKQLPADSEHSEKHDNGWPVASRSDAEHLAGALNNTDSTVPRSEWHSLNHDASALTPHPVVYSNRPTPFVNRDLTVQPALPHQTSNVLDEESKLGYPQQPSNV